MGVANPFPPSFPRYGPLKFSKSDTAFGTQNGDSSGGKKVFVSSKYVSPGTWLEMKIVENL